MNGGPDTKSRRGARGPGAWAAMVLLLLLPVGCRSPVVDGPPALTGLDGTRHTLGELSGTRAAVLVYVAVDCPIANRCLPDIMALRRALEPRGVRVSLVYPSASESAVQVRRHREEYALEGEAYRDPGFAFARRYGVRFTPEAVATTPDGTLVYRGRINDQYLALGNGRPAPTRHDLAEALEEFLSGVAPSGRVVPAVGCSFRSP